MFLKMISEHRNLPDFLPSPHSFSAVTTFSSKGPIPPELSRLTALLELDLCYNRLTGERQNKGNLYYGPPKRKLDFQHLRNRFFRGCKSLSPTLLMSEPLVNLREESSWIGRLCRRLNLPRLVKGVKFRVFLRNRVDSPKYSTSFVYLTRFRDNYRNWASRPSLGIPSLRNKPISL